MKLSKKINKSTFIFVLPLDLNQTIQLNCKEEPSFFPYRQNLLQLDSCFVAE